MSATTPFSSLDFPDPELSQYRHLRFAQGSRTITDGIDSLPGAEEHCAADQVAELAAVFLPPWCGGGWCWSALRSLSCQESISSAVLSRWMRHSSERSTLLMTRSGLGQEPAIIDVACKRLPPEAEIPGVESTTEPSCRQSPLSHVSAVEWFAWACERAHSGHAIPTRRLRRFQARTRLSLNSTSRRHRCTHVMKQGYTLPTSTGGVVDLAEVEALRLKQ